MCFGIHNRKFGTPEVANNHHLFYLSKVFHFIFVFVVIFYFIFHFYFLRPLLIAHPITETENLFSCNHKLVFFFVQIVLTEITGFFQK